MESEDCFPAASFVMHQKVASWKMKIHFRNLPGKDWLAVFSDRVSG